MHEKRINMAIVEPSDIIFEGLSNILLKGKSNLNLFRVDDLDEVENLLVRNKLQFIVMNPAQIQNREKTFRSLKNSNPELLWLGVVYSFYSNEVVGQFDGLITINSTQEEILKLVNKLAGAEWQEKNPGRQGLLSERETDVLIQLVSGLSNKEIADKLNISIHTVMSHRKSITQKIGIKSQAGLTIYAISNKIVMLENLQ
jgi:DNA-binding NarL/FixJ family response regulator